LKGERDRIPALRRKGGSEREKPEKISHFLFGTEDKKDYLCRPKSEIRPEEAKAKEGKSSLKF
jgi:hypothetical protein